MRTVLAVAVLVGGCDLVYSLDRPPTTGWAELAVGNSHLCGRTRSNELYCWGSNVAGEIGVGDELTTIDTPRKVEGVWSQVSVSYLHSCGLVDQTLSCWGYNANGQLGIGSMTATRIPKPIAGEWKKVNAGFLGSCAIDTDDKLWCWGLNTTGALGDTTTVSRLEPIPIGTARWLDVAMSPLHTCGIQDDGSLWCWGSVVAENPILAAPSLTPMQLGTDTWRSLAAVARGTCGITTTGKLRCWGDNLSNALGLGDALRADEPTPVLVDGIDEDDWEFVAGGVFAACGLRANGEAWCWGGNDRGALTSGGPVFDKPYRIRHPNRGTWSRVAVGFANACFVDTDGSAWCSGQNSFSQLADGGTSPRTPTPPAPDAPADIVAAGDHVSCTIRNNELSCGGRGAYFQLGNNSIASQRSLVPVGGGWESVSVGTEHVCGVQTGGIAMCWGSDNKDALGNGAGVSPRAAPTQVLDSRTYLAIDAGNGFTCAIASARSMFCWGDNAKGQLGNNTTAPSGLPVAVMSSANPMWSSLSAGGSHVCGIQQGNGVVRCWGNNELGQLGDNSMEDKRVASTQLVGAVPAFTKVSAGTDHTCAIGADDSLWCWGSNIQGQLGLDTGFSPNLTVPRKHEGAWRDVAAGNRFTCAVRTDTSLWCWGLNSRGQLGDGSLVDRRTPIQLPDAGWSAVTAGTDHACGLRGTDLRCWGNNDDGATLTGDAWTTELHEIVEPSR